MGEKNILSCNTARENLEKEGNGRWEPCPVAQCPTELVTESSEQDDSVKSDGTYGIEIETNG